MSQNCIFGKCIYSKLIKSKWTKILRWRWLVFLFGTPGRLVGSNQGENLEINMKGYMSKPKYEVLDLLKSGRSNRSGDLVDILFLKPFFGGELKKMILWKSKILILIY